MGMEISKRDWMLYREKIADWQENYMDQGADVTSTFSESQRHYKNTYLEICKVFDEVVYQSICQEI
jgi:hypothetical protein